MKVAILLSVLNCKRIYSISKKNISSCFLCHWCVCVLRTCPAGICVHAKKREGGREVSLGIFCRRGANKIIWFFFYISSQFFPSFFIATRIHWVCIRFCFFVFFVKKIVIYLRFLTFPLHFFHLKFLIVDTCCAQGKQPRGLGSSYKNVSFNKVEAKSTIGFCKIKGVPESPGQGSICFLHSFPVFFWSYFFFLSGFVCYITIVKIMDVIMFDLFRIFLEVRSFLR